MAFDGTILLRASVAGTAFWCLIFSTIVFSVMHIHYLYFLTYTNMALAHTLSNQSSFSTSIHNIHFYTGCHIKLKYK